MTSKEMLGHLADMMIPAKSASSALEDAYVMVVRKKMAPILEARAAEIEAAKKAEEDAAPEPRVCPFCKQQIADDATRCPHCTSVLADAPAEDAAN